MKTIIYHGSNSKFEKFSTRKISELSERQGAGCGLYLTNSVEKSWHYGRFHYAVWCKADHLVDESMKVNTAILKKIIKADDNWKDKAMDWDEDPSKGIKKAIKTYIGCCANMVDALQYVEADWYHWEPQLYMTACIDQGIDGIVVRKDIGISDYVIYNDSILEIEVVTGG